MNYIITDRNDIHTTPKFEIIQYDQKIDTDFKSNKIILLFLHASNLLKYLQKHNFKQAYENTILLHQKDKFIEFMIKNNLQSYIPNKYDSNNLKFPCIAKPKQGSTGDGITIIYTKQIFNDMRDKYKFIFQEIIFYKYSSVVHLLCRNGKIIKHIVYTTLTEYFGHIKCGSITNYTSRQLHGSESEIFDNIMNKINYTGFCCCDYSHNDDYDIKIFEINPRICGSLVQNVNDLHDFLNVAISNNCYLMNE